MLSWDKEIPHFTIEELACKGTGIVWLDMRFATKLPYLREAYGQPMTVTSVCRTPEHNAVINEGKGGHPNSLHLTRNPKHPTNGTMAADVLWIGKTREERIAFAKLAYSLGWSIGLHNSFCHIDLRKDIGLPQAVFIYGEWDKSFGYKEIMDRG